MKRPIDIGGVGTGNQQATHEVSVHIAMPKGLRGMFRAPIVPNSDLPALLGLDSLEKHAAVIDIKHSKLILPGPAGYRIVLSPGSVTFDLQKAMSGHLLLPCTLWQEHPTGTLKDKTFI